MDLIDITPIVTPDIAVFPGDVAFERRVSLDMKSGDNLTLSAINTTVHLGAHTDAPNHYAQDGADIASRSLDFYYGPCQVMTVRIPRGARIGIGDLPAAIQAPRVLFNTASFPDPNTWNGDFNSLSPELVDHLHAHGVRLIGIDTPSIDPADDTELQSHNRIAAHDMAILEGIILTDAPDGAYTLIALLLKLKDADASPVRAVLVRA